MTNARLSVAVLLNGRKIPFWVYSSIERLNNSGNADISILISPGTYETSPVRKPKVTGLILLKFIEWVDRVIFRKRYNYDLLRDVADLPGLAAVHDMTASRAGNASSTFMTEQYLHTINPDIIVKHGSHCLDDELYNKPRYGVWTYSIESESLKEAFDYGFREVFCYTPVTFSFVEAAGISNTDRITLFGSRESTCPFSINKNRNQIYLRTSLFLTRLVEGLRNWGDHYLEWQRKRHCQWGTGVQAENREDYQKNTLLKVIRFVRRISLLVFNKLLYTDAFRWQLAVKKGSVNELLSQDFKSYTPLKSASRLFWADPFIVAADNRYYLFVEEFVYRKNKAHIALVELDSDGGYQGSRKVLERPYHLSYPFVFEHDGTFYMIPETASNKTVEIYRCVSFPDRWEPDHIIMEDVLATDTTLFYHNDKWWLFTTLDQTNGIAGGSTELFLFYADSPFSEKWISHPLNPVLSDENRARCAGKVFMQDGVIYRPSQDCSMRYGRGLNFNRITRLNELEYNEEHLGVVYPVWNKQLKGMHTFNLDGNMAIIDTYRFHGRFTL